MFFLNILLRSAKVEGQVDEDLGPAEVEDWHGHGWGGRRPGIPEFDTNSRGRGRLCISSPWFSNPPGINPSSGIPPWEWSKGQGVPLPAGTGIWAKVGGGGSPDSRRFWSGTGDGTPKVWDGSRWGGGRGEGAFCPRMCSSGIPLKSAIFCFFAVPPQWCGFFKLSKKSRSIGHIEVRWSYWGGHIEVVMELSSCRHRLCSHMRVHMRVRENLFRAIWKSLEMRSKLIIVSRKKSKAKLKFNQNEIHHQTRLADN